MNDKQSYTEYKVIVPTQDFIITFEDYNSSARDIINVTVDGVPASTAGFAVLRISDTVIKLTPAVQSGSVVRLQRETDIDNTFYRFTAGAIFTAGNVDKNFQQILHSQQEVRDGFSKLANDVYPLVNGLEEALEQAASASQAAQEAAEAAEEAAQVTRSASQVNDESGKTQQEINNIQNRKSFHVLDFGMKMDGSDETAKLNEILMGLDNCKLIIGGGNLTVSKSSLYPDSFPSNDQPCIPLVDKSNLTIEISEDCEISTSKHAQGIFEMVGCVNCHIINNGSLKGAGNFPPLDGSTGRGEKGTSTAGYHTTGFWGSHKNNSFDTSSNNAGGFGGSFPQWGGGVSSTWGVWNGGFIGNQGFGILIHEGSAQCSVRGSGKIHGFNGGGVKFGSYTSSLRSRNLKCFSQDVYDCYDAGLIHVDVDNYSFEFNNVYNIGHPDSSLTDQFFDPGYGSYATAISIATLPKDGLIENNTFKKCVRKGLDVHAGIRVKHNLNTIEDCNVCGMYSSYSSANQPSIGSEFTNNTVIRCGYALGASLSAVYINGLTGSSNSEVNALVDNNKIIDCSGGTAILNIQSGSGNIVCNNTIDGIHPSQTANLYAINIGRQATSVENTEAFVFENKVYARESPLILYGINVSKATGYAKDNVVKGTNSAAIYFAPTIANNVSFDFIDNDVEVSKGLAYGVSRTHGRVSGNKSKLLGTATIGNMNNSSEAGIFSGRVITIRVTFNGTASPLITGSLGTDYIESVTSNTHGLRISFKNLNGAVLLLGYNTNSSSMPVAGSTRLGYIYQRDIFTSLAGIFGFKASENSSSHIPAENLTSGSLEFTFLAM